MDNSKFNLWRASFSFCFVDGFLSPEELKWIEEKLQILKFTNEQKSILMKDLTSPPNLEDILPLISSPVDRGFLVNNIRQLSVLDNDLSAIEKEKIESVKNKVLSSINLPELEKTIAEDEKASYHEDEVYKVYNKHSYFESVIMKLMKVANPGDYKFPKDK